MQRSNRTEREAPEIAFRPFRGPEDHQILHAIYQASNEADQIVDAINESGAFKLYTSLGYRTETIDTWYCKALSS
ncbi:hypothetical protein ACFLSW_04040 [Candidatus Bipolaricaulota bacterium]